MSPSMAPHENVIQRLNELARRVDRLEGRVMVDALTPPAAPQG